jgi:hypothetical protein
VRNATFVTPAIGASTTGLRSSIDPIRSAVCSSRKQLNAPDRGSVTTLMT